MEKKIYQLVQDKVNKHGQLHLDAIQTTQLILWLKRVDESLDAYQKIAEEIEKVVDP